MTETRPYPPYDQEIVAALDLEIQRLETLAGSMPETWPARQHPERRIVKLKGALDRYVAQHSEAGWTPEPGARLEPARAACVDCKGPASFEVFGEALCADCWAAP